MFTPQEVSEKVFPKASFGSGGYSMSSVDEFLDALTEDYTAIFKENVTLKAKLKVLAEKVEEYRSTEEAMRQRFTLRRGKVSVAAMPSFAANVLPPVLKTFRDCYSGINVTVHDVVNEQVIEMVSEGRVEMGIAFEPDYCGHVHFTPLGVDRFVAIVPADSRLANRQRVSWRDLLTLDFITLQRPSAVRLMLEEQLAQSGTQLEVALESHQLVTVGRLVANGLGGSAVPALCLRCACVVPALCPRA